MRAGRRETTTVCAVKLRRHHATAAASWLMASSGVAAALSAITDAATLLYASILFWTVWLLWSMFAASTPERGSGLPLLGLVVLTWVAAFAVGASGMLPYWTLFALLYSVAVALTGAASRASRQRWGDAQFQVGDVVWADVPFRDRSGSKDRPLIIVSGDQEALRCVYMTSRPGRRGTLRVGTGDWDAQRRKSYADPKQSFIVPFPCVRRRAGRISLRHIWAVVAAERALRHLPGSSCMCAGAIAANEPARTVIN